MFFYISGNKMVEYTGSFSTKEDFVKFAKGDENDANTWKFEIKESGKVVPQ